VLGLILCDIITTGYDAWYLFIIPMPAYIFGILYLLYSIYGMQAKNDNIKILHFGGAIGGYLLL
jgi:hypothetical protein